MPGFLTAVDHSLGQSEAQTRVSSFLDQVQNQYQDMVSSWTGEWDENKLNFELTAMNMKITGVLEVLEDAVLVGGNIPFAMLMVKGRIEKPCVKNLKSYWHEFCTMSHQQAPGHSWSYSGHRNNANLHYHSDGSGTDHTSRPRFLTGAAFQQRLHDL